MHKMPLKVYLPRKTQVQNGQVEINESHEYSYIQYIPMTWPTSLPEIELITHFQKRFMLIVWGHHLYNIS